VRTEAPVIIIPVSTSIHTEKVEEASGAEETSAAEVASPASCVVASSVVVASGPPPSATLPPLLDDPELIEESRTAPLEAPDEASSPEGPPELPPDELPAAPASSDPPLDVPLLEDEGEGDAPGPLEADEQAPTATIPTTANAAPARTILIEVSLLFASVTKVTSQSIRTAS
jgi:hypothetical protein